MVNYKKGANYNKGRKKRKRRVLRKKVFVFLVTFIVTTALIAVSLTVYKIFNPRKYDEGFIPSPFGTYISKRVKIAKEIEMPEWVGVQLIHKHTTARTGIELTDIKNIVIHYVGNPETTAQNNRDYFDKVDTTVSSHFVVGLEGEIIQCVPIYEKSAASNHRNKDTISIEVCHPDASGEFNDETYESLVKLTAYLCNKLLLDQNDVIRHYDITEKICPKYYVENEDEWKTFKKEVKKKLDEYEA